MKQLYARVSARLARRAFEAAQETALLSSRRRISPVLVLAYVLAATILLTPVLFALAGIWLIWAFFPNVFGIAGGVLLIGTGWALLPSRARVPKEAITRSDLPEFFAFLDEMCQVMQAPKVDVIVFDSDFNASVSEAGTAPFGGKKQVILTLGFALWGSLDNEGKVALLAHEIGHLVNGDPGRTGFLGLAMDTLQRWYFWTQPAPHVNPYREPEIEEGLAKLTLALFGVFLGFVYNLLVWTMMYHRQNAEYVADAKSVEVAGKGPARSVLLGLLNEPEAERALRGLTMFEKPKDGWIIDLMVDAIRNTSEEVRARYLRRAQEGTSSIDDTHPPTSFRLVFIDHLPDEPPKVKLSDSLSVRLDASFAP